MPYVSGLELAEKVSSQYPEMKIVMFSGYSDFSYAQTAIRYGVSDYILKPVDPLEFQKTMKKLLEEIEREKAEEVQQIKHRIIYTSSFCRIICTGEKSILRK